MSLAPIPKGWVACAEGKPEEKDRSDPYEADAKIFVRLRQKEEKCPPQG